MLERYKLILTHEMVFPGGDVQRIEEPYYAVYTVDRQLSRNPIVLNAVLDEFKNQILRMVEKETEDVGKSDTD